MRVYVPEKKENYVSSIEVVSSYDSKNNTITNRHYFKGEAIFPILQEQISLIEEQHKKYLKEDKEKLITTKISIDTLIG